MNNETIIENFTISDDYITKNFDVFINIPKQKINCLIDNHIVNIKGKEKISEIMSEKKITYKPIEISRFRKMLLEYKHKSKNLYWKTKKKIRKTVNSVLNIAKLCGNFVCKYIVFPPRINQYDYHYSHTNDIKDINALNSVYHKSFTVAWLFAAIYSASTPLILKIAPKLTYYNKKMNIVSTDCLLIFSVIKYLVTLKLIHFENENKKKYYYNQSRVQEWFDKLPKFLQTYFKNPLILNDGLMFFCATFALFPLILFIKY